MLMPVSFGGFQDISIKLISVSVMNYASLNWAPLRVVAPDLQECGCQDYLEKGPTWEGHRNAKASVNDCHIDFLVSCRRNMSLACWWPSESHQAVPLVSTGVQGQTCGGLRHPNERKYNFRTRWKSWEWFQKRKWGGWRKSMKKPEQTNEGPCKPWNVSLNFMELQQVFMLWTM